MAVRAGAGRGAAGAAAVAVCSIGNVPLVRRGNRLGRFWRPVESDARSAAGDVLAPSGWTSVYTQSGHTRGPNDQCVALSPPERVNNYRHQNFFLSHSYGGRVHRTVEGDSSHRISARSHRTLSLLSLCWIAAFASVPSLASAAPVPVIVRIVPASGPGVLSQEKLSRHLLAAVVGRADLLGLARGGFPVLAPALDRQALVATGWAQPLPFPPVTITPVTEILAKFLDSPDVAALQSVAGFSVVRRSKPEGGFTRLVLSTGSARLSHLALNALRQVPSLIFAEPDFRAQPVVISTAECPTSDWSYRRLHVPTSQGTRTPVVALVDSGAALSMTELTGRLWSNPGETGGASDGIDNDANGFRDDLHGWDFGDGDDDPTDTTGHGTQVASVIAASPGGGAGFRGVSRRAKLMVLKTQHEHEDDFRYDAIVDSFQYAHENGAHVINASFIVASPIEPEMLRTEIEHASDAGVLVVAAAGNQGSGPASLDNDLAPVWPASSSRDNVLSVLSLQDDGFMTPGSRFGRTTIDLGAPGRRVRALGLAGVLECVSGTSIATGLASGAAAVMRSKCAVSDPTVMRDSFLNHVDTVWTHGFADTASASGGVIDLKFLRTVSGCP